MTRKALAVFVALAWLFLLNLRSGCQEARQERAAAGRRASGRVRSALVSGSLDAPARGVARDARDYEPRDVTYDGEDSYFCAAVMRVPTPLVLVLGEELDGVALCPSAAPSGAVAPIVPAHVDTQVGSWFRDQCECRPLRALPGWVQPWVTTSGLNEVHRVGETVTGLTAAEALRRAEEAPLFMGVRGEQFRRWLDDPGDNSVFYNEASAMVIEKRVVGVVTRNVWASKRIEGRFMSTVRVDMVMHEYEVSSWSNGGCDCVPDTVSLSWAAHTWAAELRQRVPTSEITVNALVH